MGLLAQVRKRGRPAADAASVRVVHQAASHLLAYPTRELVAGLPALDAAVGEVEADLPEAARSLREALAYLRDTPLRVLEQGYVDTFDLDRKHALYLSYWTDGDTRRRGEVLAGFKRHYRDSGFVVDTHGELPDFLPLVLEYAAIADPTRGRELLQEYRASLELLRIELDKISSPYAGVVGAVCRTLPGDSPATTAEVMAMIGAGPPQPTETVGLEPYDARLLPLHEV